MSTVYSELSHTCACTIINRYACLHIVFAFETHVVCYDTFIIMQIYQVKICRNSCNNPIFVSLAILSLTFTFYLFDWDTSSSSTTTATPIEPWFEPFNLQGDSISLRRKKCNYSKHLSYRLKLFLGLSYAQLLASFLKYQMTNLHQNSSDKRPTRINGQNMV